MAALPTYNNLDYTTKAFPPVLDLLLTAASRFQDVTKGELDFATFYKDTDPLATCILASLAISVLTLILAEVTRNFSQVDRLWSILPAGYICHYAYWARINELKTDRIDTVAVVAVVWSVRLTFNYWRKGGYEWSSEDYRWEVIRKAIGKPAFFLMNITFISFIQNLLLVAITTPAYLFLILSKNFPQLEESSAKLDTIFSRCMMLAIILEFFADQQQWNFHDAKSTFKETGKAPIGWDKSELERGFLYSGLWAFSRHPNFLGEQLFWVLLYQWSAMITDSLYNWTGVGALGYCFLFQGSTWFTEIITGGKYADYKTYQKHVSMFIPGIRAVKEGGFYFPGEADVDKKTD